MPSQKPMEVPSGVSPLAAPTVGAVPLQVATATEEGDDRSGTLPEVPSNTTHDGVSSIASGKRSRYAGVYHYVTKKLFAGKVSFFTLEELSAILYQLNYYYHFIKKMKHQQTIIAKHRLLGLINFSLNSDVERNIMSFVGATNLQYIHQSFGFIVRPISYGKMLERKRRMYTKVATILAQKAWHIVQFHRGFARTFRCTDSDEAGLVTYFCERMSAEVNFCILRPTIRAMHYQAEYIREVKQERERERNYCPSCDQLYRHCRCDDKHYAYECERW